MKPLPSVPRPSGRTTAARRARLLRAFDRSGLSAAAFARQHHLRYTTFCGWRQKRAKAKPIAQKQMQGKAVPPLGFAQIEVTAPSAPAELIIELWSQVRIRVCCAGQLDLAARLLKILNAPLPC